MKEIQARLADTYFAWAGPTTNGKGAYFRIQGPAVLIEYARRAQRTTTPRITFTRSTATPPTTTGESCLDDALCHHRRARTDMGSVR